jgi:hypothetical protein
VIFLVVSMQNEIGRGDRGYRNVVKVSVTTNVANILIVKNVRVVLVLALWVNHLVLGIIVTEIITSTDKLRDKIETAGIIGCHFYPILSPGGATFRRKVIAHNKGKHDKRLNGKHLVTTPNRGFPYGVYMIVNIPQKSLVFV